MAAPIRSPPLSAFSPSNRNGKRQQTKSAYSSSICFFIIVALAVTFSIGVNLIHDQAMFKISGNRRIQFDKKTLADTFMPEIDTAAEQKEARQTDTKDILMTNTDKIATSNEHKIAGLTCDTYPGGPFSEDLTREMVYWSDIPSDADYKSPFKRDKEEAVMYMTFEPDGGGWNNIRMAMETVVVMAHAMGRTLVLPPEQRFYLLMKNKKNEKTGFSFADFFHLDSLHMEHSGLDIITMEEYLVREGMTGNLRDKDTGQITFPPGNRTNWNEEGPFHPQLKDYLRQVAYTPHWTPDACMAGFPETATTAHTQRLKDTHQSIMNEGIPNLNSFIGNPTSVDAPTIDRMKENMAGRTQMCVYDDEMQKEQVLHFMCNHKVRVRLLVHFYAFLFFEDWRQDMWSKRFVRDHLRYVDELQCAAARVVNAIRERAKGRNAENVDGVFDSMHVRRGDFQYKFTQIEADELYKHSEDLIPVGTTVYIATDERIKPFFKPLADKFDVVYLDDFKHLLKDVNTNHYGMLDQLIASRGRVFVGTYHSTFTGFINRMRGYDSVKNKLPLYEQGIIESYYFVPAENKHIMKKYQPVKRAFYAKEFPVSWRDIDRGIKELWNGQDPV